MIQTKHALFFDIDGTLVSFKTHEIPASTILALTQAKANGHRVFIATGRPPIIITNLGAIEHLIDGYVTTNGALCYVGEEIRITDASSGRGHPTRWDRLSANGRTRPSGWRAISPSSSSRGCGGSRLPPRRGQPHVRGVSGR